MTPIEIKSIQTQLNLHKDVSFSKGAILYGISDKATWILDRQLVEATIPQNVSDKGAIVSIPKSNWDEIKSFVQTCAGQNWGQLGSYSQQVIKEMNLKEEILKTL